jgi:FkbM family methyltransferase
LAQKGREGRTLEMSLADKVRPSVAGFLRTIPEFRGKGRAALLLNKALLRQGASPIVECKMAGGHVLRLDLRIFNQMHAYFSGHYNDEMLSALLAYLRPGGVALDVGANTGMCAVPMALAARERQGHLIAFEPVTSNVDWLTHNLKLNQCLGCTTIMPVGLSDHPGETEIVLVDDLATGSPIGTAVIAGRDFWPEFTRQKIQLETLDRLKEIVRVDVIKVDIDGHEHKFLMGASATIERHRPAILMEVDRAHLKRQGIDFDSIIPTLLPRDYVLAVDYGADALFVPRERNS